MKLKGIKVPNLRVEGNKAVVVRKVYDVSTELKRKRSPKTKVSRISKESGGKASLV